MSPEEEGIHFPGIEVRVGIGGRQETARDPARPAQIGVIAQFGLAGGAPPRWIAAGTEDLSHVLAQAPPRVRIESPDLELRAGGTTRADLRFHSIDCLHPDQFLLQIPAAAELLELRNRLAGDQDPSGAVLRLRRDFLGDADAGPEPAASGVASPSVPPAGLLDAIVEGRTDLSPADLRPPISPELEPALREIVRGIGPGATREERERWIAQVDRLLARAARAILRHPGFRSLERSWLSLDQLVRTLPEDVEVWLLDLSREQGLADVRAEEDIRRSILHRALLQPAQIGFRGREFALIVTDYEFSGGAQDAVFARILAAMCGMARVRLLAQAGPGLLGLGSFRDLDLSTVTAAPAGLPPDWGEFRRSEEAEWLALCLPRILLRTPYAERLLSWGGFSFAEVDQPGDHDAYAWGPGSFRLAGALLAEEARQPGGERRRATLGGLPLHTWRSAGVLESLPCAECLMPVETFERIEALGLIPFASMRDTDEVMVGRRQSLSGHDLQGGPLRGSAGGSTRPGSGRD